MIAFGITARIGRQTDKPASENPECTRAAYYKMEAEDLKWREENALCGARRELPGYETLNNLKLNVGDY